MFANLNGQSGGAATWILKCPHGVAHTNKMTEDAAKYGTGALKMARRRAAMEEKAFSASKTGHQVGIEMWRVEEIGRHDPPTYGIKQWPKEELGNFYAEDAYILLHTYKSKETDQLAMDIHVWEGKDVTREEVSMANEKASALFDLLNEQPLLHNEQQAHESALFQSYFEKSGVHYLEGDLSAGFWHVKLDDYQPRLSVVRRAQRTIRVVQLCAVPPLSPATSLTTTDVFILDLGRRVYLYPGRQCSAFAKMKGASLVQNIVQARQGKSKVEPEVDDAFWDALGGGSEADVPEGAGGGGEDAAVEQLDDYKCTLYKVDEVEGEDGAVVFTMVAEGKLREAHLDEKSTFVIDALAELFVWVGRDQQEGGLGSGQRYLGLADQFIREQGKPESTPLTRLYGGQKNGVFASLMMPKAQGGLADVSRYKKEAAKVEAKSIPLPQQKKLF